MVGLNERILKTALVVIMITLMIFAPCAMMAEEIETIIDPDAALDVSDVIRINGDSQLSATADSGSGTALDPYVIEDREIDASGSDVGILINGTSKHLVIRNCWVYDAHYADDEREEGVNIVIRSLTNLTVEKNRVENGFELGIWIDGANGVRIADNTIDGSIESICISESDNNIIDNNTCNEASWGGIVVVGDSANNIISNNTVINCQYDICLWQQFGSNEIRDNACIGGDAGVIAFNGFNNRIHNNSIIGCAYGVYLNSASDNLVRDNKLQNNIFHFELVAAESNTMINNTCTGGRNGVAMAFPSCTDNLFSHNLFQGGDGNGMIFTSGVHRSNVISGNTFRDYEMQAISIMDGNDNNDFFNNAFIDCYLDDQPQAWDDATNNWNGSEAGNYWKDHTDPDTDYNGIVDAGYLITGGSNIDHFPLTSPLSITQPSSGEIFDGASIALSGTLINPYDIETFIWHNNATGESGEFSGYRSWNVEVPLVAGNNSITVTMIERSGDEFSDNITVVYTAPTLTTDPQHGSVTYTNGDWVNVTIDAEAQHGLESVVCVMERPYMSPIRLGYGDLGGALSFNDVFQFEIGGQGSFHFHAWANDTLGNSAQISFTVVRDSIPPILEFYNLPNGSYVNELPFLITWTFMEGIPGVPGSPVTDLFFKLDSSGWNKTNASAIIFNELEEGAHCFSLMVYEAAGNMAIWSVNFTLDTAPPSLEILAPDDGTLFDMNNITVNYTVHEDTTSVASLRYRLNGGAWSDVLGDEIVLLGLPDNDHTLEIMATDLAGNSASAFVAFTVDTTAPVVSITSPAEGGYSINRTVNWIVEDVSGVDLTEVSIDGIDWTVVSGTSRTFMLADGTYTVYVRVTDKVGLVGTESVNFTVDTLTPTVEVTWPTGDAYNNTGSVLVQWNAADANDIAKTEISTDGSSWSAVSGTNATVTGLTDGTWTIYVRVTDPAGNTMTDSATVGVSISGPAVKLVPNGTVYTRDDILDITANISDAVPLTSVVLRVYIDGELVNEMDLSADILGDKTALISSPIDLEEGANVISLTVNDSAGNSVVVEVTVVLDTTAPTLVIDFPMEGARLNLNEGFAQWTASDGGSGLNNTWARMDDGAWTELGSAEGCIFTSLTEGEHILFLRVDDHVGNLVEKNVTFVVDTTAPTAEASPTGDQVDLDTVVLVEFSEQMNVTSVIVVVDGVAGNVSWEGNVLTFTPSALVYAHNYTVTVSGLDLAGNALEMNWTFRTVAGTGSLTGTVVDSDGDPLANVTVRVGDQSAVTNQIGRFILNGLAPGNYVLTVDQEGYEMYSDTVTVVAGEADELGPLTLIAEGADEGGDMTLIIVMVAVLGLAGVGAALLLLRKRK